VFRGTVPVTLGLLYDLHDRVQHLWSDDVPSSERRMLEAVRVRVILYQNRARQVRLRSCARIT